MEISQDDAVNLFVAALSSLERMNTETRDIIGSRLADRINGILPRAVLAIEDQPLVQELYQEGAARLGQVLDPTVCERIVSHFQNVGCFGGHVPARSDGIRRMPHAAKETSRYGSYELADVLAVPELFSLVKNQRFLGIADAYLGCIPSVYSAHVFWTFAGSDLPAQTHQFHRDLDDFRFLSLFVYLTDTSNDNGPVHFLNKSHNLGTARPIIRAYLQNLPDSANGEVNALDYFPPHSSDANQLISAERIFADLEEVFWGDAGTAFIMDSYGLHRGSSVKSDRLVLWIRFGVGPNLAYMIDRTLPVPIEKLAHVNFGGDNIPWPYRLIVKR